MDWRLKQRKGLSCKYRLLHDSVYVLCIIYKNLADVNTTKNVCDFCLVFSVDIIHLG